MDNLPTIAITEEMLKPLVEGVVANVGVILPIGLGLFAIFLGIRISCTCDSGDETAKKSREVQPCLKQRYHILVLRK